MISEKEIALQWWNKMNLEEKFYEVISWLRDKNINVTEKHPNDLTETEIEEIWRKQNQEESFEDTELRRSYMAAEQAEYEEFLNKKLESLNKKLIENIDVFKRLKDR